MKKYVFFLAVLCVGNALAKDVEFVNEDQSVSIMKPKAFDAPISLSGSDVNGICKLFGYKSWVIGSVVESTGLTLGNAAINRYGDLTEIKKDLSRKIEFITCRKAQNSPARGDINSARFAEKVTDRFGNVNVIKPFFQMNGDKKPISSESDWDGVCKRYGLKRHIPGTLSITDPGELKDSVVLDESSKFVLITHRNVIQSIGCL